MKPFLNLLEMEIPSIESLNLGDKKRLLRLWSQLATLRTVQEAKFFGSGNKLRPIESVDQLAQGFRKIKPGTCSFADVKDLTRQEAHLHWSIGIRKAFLTVTVECESSAEGIVNLSDELLVLNQILLSAVSHGKVASPFSFLMAP